VLPQQITEGFIGKLLKILHCIVRKEINRSLRLIVKLNALAWHLRTLLEL
jgi:hypothetical protein